jgi:RND family efflux transporter MFP subunit
MTWVILFGAGVARAQTESDATPQRAPLASGFRSSTGGATTGSSAKSSSDAPSNPNQIIVQRQRLRIRAPEKYQVSMQLEPVRSVRLAAPFGGIVKAIVHKTGERVESGTEIIRLDTTEKQLQLDRAKALYHAAQIEVQLSATGGGSNSLLAKQLADAKLQAAKADLDLAVYWVEQASVRAPFNAEIFRIEVPDGQVVRPGQTLAVVADTSILKTELPVDRNTIAVKQALQVKVEDQSLSGKVEAILPLSSRFEALRDLMPAAASAIVVFQNPDGKLKAGQTVYSPLVPRDPIAEVPNSSIGNVPDGSHKVQVLRDNVVRDIRIATLAPVGADRSFVSGPLDSTDEVIVSSSQELADGTLVRPSKIPAPQEASKGPGSTLGTNGLPAGGPPASPTVKGKGI